MFAEIFNNPYFDTSFMTEIKGSECTCPVCKKDLAGYTKEYVEKHLRRCGSIEPKYIYSDKGRGRPPKKKKITTC